MPFKEGVSLKTQFKKGQSGNLNGSPRGVRKRTKLKKLLKDLKGIIREGKLSETEIAMVYQIYDIAISDHALNSINDDVKDLYFFESSFGIKIGKSKDVENRLKTIKQSYAPEIKLIKKIPNGGKFEGKLHKKFRHQNIKNNPTFGIEWFYKNDDLIAFIDEINTVNDLVDMFGSKVSMQLKIEY